MAIPTEQKAGLLAEAGKPVAVETRAVPTPGPGHVLIQVTAAAINPVDWKMRDGLFPASAELPVVLGSDGARRVAAAGAGVDHLRPGDRVFFQGRVGRSDLCVFQQYCICPAALVGRIPDAISEDEAAGVSLASICAVTMLFTVEGQGIAPEAPQAAARDQVASDRLSAKGRALLVLGGSSSVGQYAIQLARLAGFSVVVTSASAAHLESLRTLGATAALDRKTADVDDYVHALGGCPLDAIVDGISSEDTQNLAVSIWAAAADANGDSKSPWRPSRRISTGWYPFDSATERAAKVNSSASLSSHPIEIRMILGLGHEPGVRPVSEWFYAAAGGEHGWLAKRQLRPNKVKVVDGGLNGLQEALELNKNGVSGYKVVIRPHETL